MLESYRLFELSFAMQLCGKLPQDTADIDLTDLYEPYEDPSSEFLKICIPDRGATLSS